MLVNVFDHDMRTFSSAKAFLGKKDTTVTTLDISGHTAYPDLALCEKVFDNGTVQLKNCRHNALLAHFVETYSYSVLGSERHSGAPFVAFLFLSTYCMALEQLSCRYKVVGHWNCAEIDVINLRL